MDSSGQDCIVFEVDEDRKSFDNVLVDSRIDTRPVDRVQYEAYDVTYDLLGSLVGALPYQGLNFLDLSDEGFSGRGRDRKIRLLTYAGPDSGKSIEKLPANSSLSSRDCIVESVDGTSELDKKWKDSLGWGMGSGCLAVALQHTVPHSLS